MASNGRPRKSVQELKLSGMYSKRSSHKNYNDEVPNQMELKTAPKRYLQRTKVAWNQFMRVKVTQGILSEEDASLICIMFDALDNLYHIQDEIDRFFRRPDLTSALSDEDRRKQLKDMVQVRKLHETSFVTLACRFGLTPSERTKLVLPQKKAESPLLKLINEA